MGEQGEERFFGVLIWEGRPGAERCITVEACRGLPEQVLWYAVPTSGCRLDPADRVIASWGERLPTALLRELVTMARAGEREVDRPADREWTWNGDDLRRLALTTETELPGRLMFEGIEGEADLDFSLDADHNPYPLSPANCSLVGYLERYALLPFRQCTYDGYLYVATRRDGTAASTRPTVLAPTTTRLQRALEEFGRFAGAYFETAAHHRIARHALVSFLMANGGEALANRAGELLAGIESAALERDQRLAAGEPMGRFGAFSPEWDLAAPSYAEEPDPLSTAAHRLSHEDLMKRRAVTRRRAGEATHEVRQSLSITKGGAARPPPRRQSRRGPHPPRPAPLARDSLRSIPATESIFAKLLAAAREAAANIERDDIDFAVALATLRKSFLEAGRELAARGVLASPEDVFFLSITQIVDALAGPAPMPSVQDAAFAGRTRWAMQRLRPPPAMIRGRMVLEREPRRHHGRVLRGIPASSGKAHGRARIVHAPGRLGALQPGTILVVRTATPAFSFLLPQCAALVTEHGGMLSHAAVLAREYGVPAVVSVQGATRAIADGAEIVVDGATGIVSVDTS